MFIQEHNKLVSGLVFFLSLIAIPLQSVIGQQLYSKKNENQLVNSLAIVRAATVSICSYNLKTKVKSPKFSGVVVSSTGLVLSAAHAVDPGLNYLIDFPNGRRLEAIGLGEIPFIDATMLKITGINDLPFVEMGRSSILNIGQPCFGLSYPASFGHAMQVLRFGEIADMSPDSIGRIRTTCLMEPGDSGGPLFDLEGRLIGIHSGIGLELDMNFEIPIDNFRRYWSALQKPVSYERSPGEDGLKFIETPKSNRNVNSLRTLLTVSRSRYDGVCVSITSRLAGKIKEISGTLIDKFGFVISKSSMVGDSIIISIGRGELFSAKVVKRDSLSDLVLLNVHHTLKNGIPVSTIYPDSLDVDDPGSFLFSPIPFGIMKASVLGTTSFDLDAPYSYFAFLGADFENRNGKAVISTILQSYSADIAKLSVGDRLVKVNGVQINNTSSVHFELMKLKPGDEVELVVDRNDTSVTKKLRLGRRPFLPPSPHIAEKFTDGKSVRRDGFKNVFVHDAKLKPSECGGPVFDLKGRFIGINIARYSRTSSIAISASEVKKFLEGVQFISDTKK